MFLPKRLLRRFYFIFWCSATGFALLPLAATAQDSAAPDKAYAVVKSIEAPRGDAASNYRSVAASHRVMTDPIYATELTGQLASGKAQPIQRSRRSRIDIDPIDLNGFGVVLALGIIIGALLLWLKFGGSGVLLSREPSETAPQNSAPDNWEITASEIDRDARSMLDQIASMADRSAAMVLLLRYCLLAAAQTTGSRFARSDTERSAFRRLPSYWVHLDGLETILRQAELAHYGGRPVGSDVFTVALETGRIILSVNKTARTAHG